MQKKILLAFSVSMFLLQACGSGRTYVFDPVQVKYPVNTVSIQGDSSTVQIPEELREYFETTLQNKLQVVGFSKGTDLTIVYRFVQCDQGDQFTRYFFGGLGNMGEGSLTIEAKFLDRSKKEVGKIHAEGKIGSGVLGGSFNHAIEQAAEHLTQYMSQNFRNK